MPLLGRLPPETAFAAGETLSKINRNNPMWWGNPLNAIDGQLVQQTTAVFDDSWALPLVHTYANFVKTQFGSQRLVLLDASAGWPDLSPDEWQIELEIPILLAAKENMVELMADDAVFWMGSATDGADMFFLVQAQRANLTAQIPFGMGPQGGDIVFANHAGAGISSVYWVTWLDDGYAGWHEAHSHLQMPQQNYLVYRKTEAIIDRLLGASSQTSDEQVKDELWEPYLFELMPDGQSVLVE